MQPISLFDQTADVLTPSGKTIRNADLAADPFFGVLMSEPCAVTYGERGEMLTLQPLEALKSMYGVTEEDPDAAVVAIQSKMDESDHRVKATMVSCESLQRQLDALGGMEPDAGNDARTSTIAQVRAFVMMAVQPMAATMADGDALSVSTLWPEWSGDGVSYAADAIVRTGNQLWRCVQAHTSQADWSPEAAPSLWSRIDIAGDGVEVWTQPTGAHDAYNTGDRVHYPTASDPIYVSTIDGNVWAPDAYPQGWQLEAA